MMKSCAVPGCNSGTLADRKRCRTSNIRQPTLFKVPKGATERRQWEICLNNTKLKAGDVICEEHFEDDDVQRFESGALADGTTHNNQRFWYSLNKGALPSILTPKDRNENHTQIEVDDHTFHTRREDEDEPPNKISRSKEPIIIGDLNRGLLTVRNAIEQLKTYHFPEGCCWMKTEENSIIFIIFNKLPRKLGPRAWLELRDDSSVWVWVHQFKKTKLADKVSSVTEVLGHCQSVMSFEICSGTGFKQKPYSKSCYGFMDDEDTSQLGQTIPRCKSCRHIREKVLSRSNVNSVTQHGTNRKKRTRSAKNT